MSTYGARLPAPALGRVIDHIWSANERAEAEGRWPTPICIWGSHGIGKTMLVERLAAERGMKFAYCAPAQFEEMGDLNGMPVVGEEGRTRFAAPDWVPHEEGPGVLLLDDINRADDRILRGLMQLFQTGGLVSWSLPPRWQIVATANPDDGDYSVTAMDDAMLTRFRHLTMVFEVEAWVRWAEAEGLDARGIAFVRSYPELNTGRRTTPRTLTAFFQALEGIADWKSERELVQALGLSSLDDSTTAAFLHFLDDGMDALPTALDVLETRDFEDVKARIASLRGTDGNVHTDRLGLVCERVVEHIRRDDYAAKPEHMQNLIRFLLEAPLPNDMRVAMHQRIVSECRAEVARLVSTPAVSKKMLLGM